MNPHLARALADQHAEVKAKKPRPKTTAAPAAEEKAAKSAETDNTPPSKEK
jgi:hypothetical protein